jgi:hypothetical protein
MVPSAKLSVGQNRAATSASLRKFNKRMCYSFVDQDVVTQHGKYNGCGQFAAIGP